MFFPCLCSRFETPLLAPKIQERGSRDFQDLERFLGKTMEESNNFNDLLDKDDRERFLALKNNMIEPSQMGILI